MKNPVGRRLLAFLLTLALCCGLCAPALADSDPPAPSISLSSNTLELKVGETYNLTATTNPADATVEWSSSNPEIATVANGTVTAVAEGEATITAKIDGTNASDTCTVTVEAAAPVDVTGVTLNKDTLSLTTGQLETLTATVEPDNATDKTVSWESSNTNVATVTPSGTVTAVSTGTATITVKTTDSGKTATCAVTVTAQPSSVDSIALDKAVLTLEPNNPYTLTATIIPDSAPKTVEWSTDNASVVAITPSTSTTCTIRGVSGGEAIITARAAGGKSAQCRVTVPGIALNTSKLDLKQKETGKLSVTIFGGSSLGSGCIWTSSDPAIARVAPATSTGSGAATSATVTALSEGTVKITAAAQSNPNYKAECTVTVSKNTASIIYETADSTSPLRMSDVEDKISSQCRNVLSSDLNYVTGLSVPTDAGTLYYGYISADSPGQGVATSKSYYYTDSPNVTGNLRLSNVTFVPKSTYGGAAVISYAGQAVSGATFTGTIEVSIEKATDVAYSVGKGQSVTFNSMDFNRISQNRNGQSLDYVSFTLPNTSRGTLYYNYSGSANYGNKVLSSTNYYHNGNPDLSKVTFVPASGYTGTFTISYTARDKGSNAYSGKVTITVSSGGGTGDINYKTDSGDYVTFKNSDFNTMCKDVTGDTLNYIRFDNLPASSKGTLYYDYRSNGNYDTKVSTGTRYYRSSSRYISSISFAAKSSYTGTVTIDFTGYSDENESFTGTISIEVGEDGGSSGDIRYTTAKNTRADFNVDDFNEYSRAQNGKNLDYIRFDKLPSTSKGTLYYKYRSSGSYDSKVSASTSYYRNSSRYLDDVTFVPASDYTGTAEIDFTGYDTSGNKFSGTVSIKVGSSSSSSADVSYKTAKNTRVTFDVDDFNEVSRDHNGKNLNYIRFDELPASTRGTLYYKYVSSSSYDSKVSTSTSYYRNSSRYLDEVSFVPYSGYTGTVEIDFTGYDTSGDRFSGTVEIEVGGTDSSKTITYRTMAGRPAKFRADDFNAASKSENNRNLNYVRFTLPSSSRGTLYYKYSSANDFDSKVSSSTSYYRNSSRYLDDVSFVPASGFTGTAEIEFTGYDTNGDRFSGTVQVTVGSSTASGISYTVSGGAVAFRASDFNNVCRALTGVDLDTVRFSSLPSSSQGALYYDYSSAANPGSAVGSSTTYFMSGTPLISRVSFVPAAGYSGTVSLSYTAQDKDGFSYTGRVEISVPAAAGPASSFNDLGNHSWAIPAIEYLYAQGVVNGTGNGRFSPEAYTSRGDFALMIVRAFSFAPSAGGSFADVPSDSYYASAIATAQALDIVQGTGGNRFNPDSPVTREDAMVMLQRAMINAGWSIDTGDDTDLVVFPDRAQISSYARIPVATMARAGIVSGDERGRLNPRANITRAEMSALLYKALTQ